jgi:hypothetical protein
MRAWRTALGEDTPTVLIPWPPVLPDPEPPVIEVVFNYEQLKAYRLQSQPYIVRANYDMVQWMLEDRFLEKRVREYIEWLDWIEANL